jgi:outer membrane usher protein FimD/PapC
MNPQPKQTISKTETELDQASYDYVTNEFVEIKSHRQSFKAGANWKEQHSYSEQEQWVSVKDRLPTDGQFYLTCYKSNYYYRCEPGQVYTRKDGSKCFVDDSESAINATHWMPLPAPPKQ